ncbi:Serine/threonine-protein kinase HT1 [Hordeum vulgare]|nr:Serine/threonine-protein kinase HT1 [Hordeum vulgare]
MDARGPLLRPCLRRSCDYVGQEQRPGAWLKPRGISPPQWTTAGSCPTAAGNGSHVTGYARIRSGPVIPAPPDLIPKPIPHMLRPQTRLQLVGACRSAPVFCVITEFLPGGSLRSFLRKLEGKQLPLDKILSIALDIARGLEYVHSQGVIHHDVKPGNILFDAECCAKVVDFGVAFENVYCNTLSIVPSSCPAPLQQLMEQCWSAQPEKRPVFTEIVQTLENLKTALDRDGTIEKTPTPSCQEAAQEQSKNRLASRILKLSYSPPDFSGPHRRSYCDY